MNEPVTFDVAVWDVVNGDLVKRLRQATQTDIDDLEDQYGDNPQYEIVIGGLNDF